MKRNYKALKGMTEEETKRFFEEYSWEERRIIMKNKRIKKLNLLGNIPIIIFILIEIWAFISVFDYYCWENILGEFNLFEVLGNIFHNVKIQGGATFVRSRYY